MTRPSRSRGRLAGVVRVLSLMQRLMRARATIPELAREYVVSERTIRRDLDVLSLAGVPVMSSSDRHGFWSIPR